MEETNEEVCIAKLFGFKGNKNKKANKKPKKKAETEIVTVVEAEDSARAENNDSDDASTSRVRISLFEYSVENFFRDMDTIARLCGEEDALDFEQSEIQRLSSSVTFLREWRGFKYPPRSIRFDYGPGSSEGKDVSTINLPQFSSATVPMYDMQKEDQLGDAKSQESRDFVMYVGGPVWALDWCPQIHEKPDCSIKCEFIAVAAHPPGSSYHKMGAPLTGRGVIQIWCLLNIRGLNEEVCSLTEKREKRPKKGGDTKDKSTQIKRPRGRPRKNPIEVSVDDMNCETQNVPALDVLQFPEDSAEFPTPDGNLEKDEEIFPTTNKRKRGPKENEATNEKSGQIKRPRGRPKKNSKEVIAIDTNCENQAVQALAVQVLEDSAEFISPDVAHDNIASQENSVTKQKQQIKRPRGRPKNNSKEVIVVDTNCENQAVQALAVQVLEDSAEFISPDVAQGNIVSRQNSVTKQKLQIKRPRGRPKKNSKEVIAVDTNCENQAVQALAVQVLEDSAEFISPDVAHGNIALQQNSVTKQKQQIKRPMGRPKRNSKEVTAVDTNCENQAVQALAVQVLEDSAEFISPDVADGNIASQQNSVAKQKHAKKTASTCNTSSKTPIKRIRLKINGRRYSQDISQPLLTHCENSKEIIAVDTNCENQAVQALAVQVLENSAEFISPDVAHGNIASQQNSVTKQKQQIKRPMGRPKKNSKEVIAVDTNCENQAVQALAVQVLDDSAEFISSDEAHGNIASPQNSVIKQKHAKKKTASACNTSSKTPIKRCRLKINRRSYSQDRSQPLLTHCENEVNHQPHCSSELGPLAATHSITGQLSLPRVVSCLAHNGKVAWDVKWRPPNMSDSLCKHRMGYLAVLLGNGSLEVWEVPLPRVLRAIYMHKEGNDPRFIKLEPVFKCSMLKRGGLQSIPLTVEWSVTPPHDYLLAGCHDGTVALWKFSKNASSKCDDTKPVLCFGGDTAPIRAVAWAPFDGDPESSNIIVTAGHEGLKFWDLRNPFRPLRNLHPAPRIIYSLDWLSKPSCIIMSFEDGTMRTISLVKAANDLPVSGKTYTGKKQPGLHSSSYSSFAIWSVQVSRITGMVAYCGAEGTVFRFQLTSKAVETDHSRNRAPPFLCGSVTEEESTLIIKTPVSNTPFPKKSYERIRHAQSFRELLSKSNISTNANNQMAKASNSDSQTLALCDGDDLGLESESEEALSSVEQPKRPNLTHSNRKKPVESLALVCRDDVSTSTLGVDNEKSNFGNIPEVFPSKMVALHRVRWNMNKGSERWLCSGGAGGIVRCQEIVFSNIEKKWALKR